MGLLIRSRAKEDGESSSGILWGKWCRLVQGTSNMCSMLFHTEVIAALEGIKMAEMAGMAKVELGTDALLKLDLLHDSFKLSSVGGLIHVIKERL